jgi:hypothetical protein
MILRYINTKNQELYLSGGTYLADSAGLFDFEWRYNGVNNKSRGGRIESFYRDISEFNLPIEIHAYDRRQFYTALTRLYSIVDMDVAEKRPGRLVLDTDEYMECYIVGSTKTEWKDNIRTVLNGIKLVTERPFWCRDVRFSYYPGGADSGGAASGLDYLFDYAFDYAAGSNIQIVENDNYTAADFEMVIFGAATNPTVTIGANIYTVGTDAKPVVLYAGDRLVINSRGASIKQIKPDGEVVNRYGWRDFVHDVFAPIPSGKNVMSSNAYFDLTMFQERSEPRWNL